MKKIVIIGGGFAGAYAAKHLEKDFEVTLIDTKDYFEFTPSVLRALVKPSHVKKIQVMHTHYLKNATVLRGTVKTVNSTYVLFDHKKLPFDYLLICSGSRYNKPFKQKNVVLATRGSVLRDYYHKLCEAKSILIIGGGIVGVELAAEIATHCQEPKQITLAHSRDRIMQRNNQKTINYATNFLKKHQVQLIFDGRVVGDTEDTFVTKGGTKIKADLVFMCTGITSNSAFMQQHFKAQLNERQQIKVNSFMQVEGCGNIFACGDVNNSPEEKTAQSAEKQATVAVENIYRLEKNNKSLAVYHSVKKPMIISLGEWAGVLEYKNFTWTGILPGLLKAFVEWKAMLPYK